MLPTRSLRVAFAALAIFVVACSVNTGPKATYANALATYSLVALTGGSALEPNAISFLAGGATRATATFNFDVVFDIDANGQTIVFPVRSIGGALAGALKRVGMQVVPGGFDALRVVPLTGYDTVNALKVGAGSAVAVELLDRNACFSITYLTSSFIYAKFVVDSVNPTARRIYTRAVVDPNCGFRSVVPDSVPKSIDGP